MELAAVGCGVEQHAVGNNREHQLLNLINRIRSTGNGFFFVFNTPAVCHTAFLLLPANC